MTQHTHLFNPGAAIPCTAATDVEGGQLVAVTASPRQVSATSGSTESGFGVAAFDAAAGERVTVLRGGVQHVKAAAPITAGKKVVPAADGQVAPLGEAGNPAHVVGTATTTAAAAGAVIEVAFI